MNFVPSLMAPKVFRQSLLNRCLADFGSMLYQTVHLESVLRYFWIFSLFDSALWFLLKTCFRIRWVGLEIFFSLSLTAPEVSQQILVNWSLADIALPSTNQCTHNQTLGFSAVFLCLIVLFDFLLKHAFELEKVTSK